MEIINEGKSDYLARTQARQERKKYNREHKVIFFHCYKCMCDFSLEEGEYKTSKKRRPIFDRDNFFKDRWIIYGTGVCPFCSNELTVEISDKWNQQNWDWI